MPTKGLSPKLAIANLLSASYSKIATGPERASATRRKRVSPVAVALPNPSIPAMDDVLGAVTSRKLAARFDSLTLG